ncbi:MAG TPA: phytanoyl-CoA dioxygenase family protein [Kineosporiaceae bacterium]|nr:phytanoyl-CoA dioxygenase family protein [Kineosporiaceae bacterium]
MATTPTPWAQGWLTEQDCRLEDFRAVVEQPTDLADYPLAQDVEQNVLIYGERLRGRLDQPGSRRQAQAELAHALLGGPGIVVLQGAFDDLSVVDRATSAFTEMIADQKAVGQAAGDHFAAPGANDRVWGALDKLAVRAPEVFTEYYANDLIALISHAWLGPNYQLTSQINVVNPGGQAQVAHRDYHLGFMSGGSAGQYPAHIQRLSPLLTLQGAVAHCDMPIETGPTMYLPHSQKYEPGYLAFHRPEFTEYFDHTFVQLPLSKGDAVFFNPAVFHGAGTNRSADVRRMANLLQVSSAFGRAMETVDRQAMSVAVFGPLVRLRASGASEQALCNVVAACAEGYAFPTNLDRDQPVDGLVPQTQAELLRQALDQGWTAERLEQQLQALARRHDSAVRP